jgi:hypothetical protein
MWRFPMEPAISSLMIVPKRAPSGVFWPSLEYRFLEGRRLARPRELFHRAFVRFSTSFIQDLRVRLFLGHGAVIEVGRVRTSLT